MNEGGKRAADADSLGVGSLPSPQALAARSDRTGDVCHVCGVVTRPPMLSAPEAAAKFAQLRAILARDREAEAERAAMQAECR